ncbi:MAG: hypothetical protein LUO81_03630, partial [Methanoregulaceae archaeon]|nr:hypothetical protein [Methanoregulaceae archaeon]
MDQPDIWGDNIVWQTYEDDNTEIHILNLSTNQEERLTNDQVNQIKPKIWNNWIVWQEGIEGESDCSVHLYDLQTGNVTKLGDKASSSAKSPTIWGDRVVWDDSRNGSMGNHDIYLFNLTSGNETQITTDSYAQISPSIWDDRIVWIDNRDNSQIYLYDLNSGNETCITSGDFHRESPVIYGDNVVYVNDTVVSL